MPMKIESPTEFHLAVQAFIAKEKILKPGQAVLCAISGGVDSMVLGTVLMDLGYPVSVAHFNFKLRGIESNEDEAFVKNWALENHLPFYLGPLPSPEFWQREGRGKNIQMEARRLRYDWLRKLQKKVGIDQIATGHHADDQEETILMNFFRGTGISGLRGILPDSNRIIRPLLFMDKKSIVEFARVRVKHWRNDSSNEGDSYKRNEIRHHLKPILESLFPGFNTVVNRNAERLRLAEKEIDMRYHALIDQFALQKSSDYQAFDFSAVKNHASGPFFLSELLLKAGFEFNLMKELMEIALSTESRTWSKGQFCLELKDTTLTLSKLKESVGQLNIQIHGPGNTLILGFGQLSLELEKGFKSHSIKQPNLCHLDSSMVVFPISVTLWQAGDKFKPFGMNGKSKLVSDLLTEKGLSQAEKNRTLIVRNGDGKILWVVGVRTSEWGKITSDTTEILKLVWDSES